MLVDSILYLILQHEVKPRRRQTSLLLTFDPSRQLFKFLEFFLRPLSATAPFHQNKVAAVAGDAAA